mgnify:CR=1 FL=1
MTERDRQFAYEQEYSRLRQAAFDAGFRAVSVSSFRKNDRCYVGYMLMSATGPFAEPTLVAGDNWVDAFDKAHKELIPAIDRLLAKIGRYNTQQEADSEERERQAQMSWLRKQQL